MELLTSSKAESLVVELICECGNKRQSLPNSEHLCKCGKWGIYRDGKLIQTKNYQEVLKDYELLTSGEKDGKKGNRRIGKYRIIRGNKPIGGNGEEVNRDKDEL